MERAERKEIGWNGGKSIGQGLEWFLSTFATLGILLPMWLAVIELNFS